MITPIPVLFLAVLGQSSHSTVTRRSEVRLVDLTPVTQVSKSAVFKMSKEFSIGGIVLKAGIQLLPQGDSSPDRSGRLVYSVPRGSQVFRGKVGIPDTDTDGASDATLTIYVDGESVKEISARAGQKASMFEVPVKSAKSVMLQFTGTASIGDAYFSTNPSSVPNSKPAPRQPQPAETVGNPPKANPTEMARANLTSPDNGATFKNGVTFKWDAVPDAVEYGVEIVMVSNANPRKTPTRYIRAFSAKSDSFEWNFSDDVLSGEYQVSVIAFGREGVLTKFSNSRRFKVTRK